MIIRVLTTRFHIILNNIYKIYQRKTKLKESSDIFLKNHNRRLTLFVIKFTKDVIFPQNLSASMEERPCPCCYDFK